MKKSQGKSKAKKLKFNKLWLLPLSSFILLIVVYIGGIVFFSTRFLVGTQMNGVDVSRKTVAEVESLIQDKVSSYKLEIKERHGVSEHIAAREVELRYVADGDVKNSLKSQNIFMWPFVSFEDKEYEVKVGLTMNEEKASSVVSNLGVFDSSKIVPLKDAYIDYQDGSYKIIPEEKGTEIEVEQAKEVIINALREALPSVDLEGLKLYKNPKITSEDKDLLATLEKLRKFEGVDITYNFGDNKENVSGANVREWLYNGEDGQYVLDGAKVREYVEGLAFKYNTINNPFHFRTSRGYDVIINQRNLGWSIDVESTISQLTDFINEGQQGTFEPVYARYGMIPGSDSIGGTYVEISLEEQHLWAYSNGQLVVETDVVTGNVGKYATPGGLYKVSFMQRDATLDSEQAGVKDDKYRTKVKYWMPFNGHIGLHDSSWRSAYGGNIFRGNGSHGCINTPPDAMAKIFEVMDAGYPVVLY